MKAKIATLLSALVLTTAFAGEASAYAAYATTTLNVRSGPGTGYPVITSLGRGQRVEVVGCSGAWCEIDLGRGQGFANASYLSGPRAGRVYAAPPPVIVTPEPYYAPQPYFVQRYDYYDRRNFNYRDDYGYRPQYRERYRERPNRTQRLYPQGNSGNAVTFGPSGAPPRIPGINGDSGMTLQQQHERNSSN